jgi:catechol 2,3-dioxygenase-like lactoylglutathione lyase family enzyme
MNLEIHHVEVHVSSLEKAREFYVGQLDLLIIEDVPSLNFFSLRAGSMRISIFGGYEPIINSSVKRTSTHIIFRTNDINITVKELRKKGLLFMGEIFEAPGFLRGITTMDPDGNIIEIAQYLTEPSNTFN